MGSFSSGPQTQTWILHVSHTRGIVVLLCGAYLHCKRSNILKWLSKWHPNVNKHHFSSVSLGWVTTQTQQDRWSLPSVTPWRKTGFSSLFTPAGFYKPYVTHPIPSSSSSSHFKQKNHQMLWMWSLYTDRALVARSKDGADPYVSFILLPDKKATTKRKTATKKKDLSPEFNERQDKQIGLWL